jgi:predicted transcriptional regulator
MTDKTKIRIVVDEDAAIVERLDAIAAAESISRADVLRRAIRRLVFSMPTVPTFENISVDESAEPITV